MPAPSAMRVSASAYYRAALRADPKNPVLLERTFLSVLVDGDIDEAVKLAERVIQFDKTHRVARLVLGVRALKQKQYQAARQHIAQSVRGPIADLTATLITAWTQYGSQRDQGRDREHRPPRPVPSGTRSSRICMPG